jgi:LysM repeat protein
MYKSRGILNKTISLVLFVIFSYGCSSNIDTLPLSPTATKVVLTPFIRSTTENTENNLLFSTTEKSKSTPISSPSPTPFRYSVKRGDTFTSIAFVHGVNLNDLIAANPDVDPNFLTIGMTITIPFSKTHSIPPLNPTPIPLSYEVPTCYPTQVGGLWCIVEVVNIQPFDIENLSARFSITSNELNEEIYQVAYCPINVLPPNLKIPLMAYFETPIPSEYQAQVEILSVIPKSKETERYLTPIIQNQDIKFSENFKKATILGEFKILEDQDATKIWIVAVAYSKNGEPVGVRKWETSTLLQAGEKRSFKIYLYSLGPQISDVKIIIEAEPS